MLLSRAVFITLEIARLCSELWFLTLYQSKYRPICQGVIIKSQYNIQVSYKCTYLCFNYYRRSKNGEGCSGDVCAKQVN